MELVLTALFRPASAPSNGMDAITAVPGSEYHAGLVWFGLLRQTAAPLFFDIDGVHFREPLGTDPTAKWMVSYIMRHRGGGSKTASAYFFDLSRDVSIGQDVG